MPGPGFFFALLLCLKLLPSLPYCFALLLFVTDVTKKEERKEVCLVAGLLSKCLWVYPEMRIHSRSCMCIVGTQLLQLPSLPEHTEAGTRNRSQSWGSLPGTLTQEAHIK